jgi:membrane associated rhomboid family serine protease
MPVPQQIGQQSLEAGGMRALEIIVGLIVAAILFVVLKVIGIVIKFALIAAIGGFVVGAAITMMFRSRST